jgi:hypothetical protein
MQRPTTLLALVAMALACASCALVPRTKETGGSLQTSERLVAGQSAALTRAVTGSPAPVSPQPNVTVSGKGSATVTITPPPTPPPMTENLSLDMTGQQSAAAALSQAWFSRIKIPLWVALIGTSAGLLLLLYAVNAWRKSSASLNAAFTLADGRLAAVIKQVESHGAVAQTGDANAMLANIRASLESARGAIAAKAPPR